VGAEQAAIRMHQVRSTKLPPVADQSADPRSGVRAAVIVEVESHRVRHQAEVRRVGFRLAKEPLAAAMVRRVVALPDVEARPQSYSKARALKSWVLTPLGQQA
jgi:hypothetical protein